LYIKNSHFKFWMQYLFLGLQKCPTFVRNSKNRCLLCLYFFVFQFSMVSFNNCIQFSMVYRLYGHTFIDLSIEYHSILRYLLFLLSYFQ
jgi:hypothetical protein